jgi:ATP-dependent protease ClpP protease subunit
VNKKATLVVEYRRRFIWFDGYITPRIASRFKKILDRLNNLKCFPIIFYIRGVGGDAYSAFSMMSEITNSASPVAIVAHDFVNSACFTMTQSGAHRLALKGTVFSFHPSVQVVSGKQKAGQITQEEMLGTLDALRLIDGMQLYWFMKKGRPVKEVFSLFNQNKTINLAQARKLKLVDDFYQERDFRRDRLIIRKKLKARK